MRRHRFGLSLATFGMGLASAGSALAYVAGDPLLVGSREWLVGARARSVPNTIVQIDANTSLGRAASPVGAFAPDAQRTLPERFWVDAARPPLDVVIERVDRHDGSVTPLFPEPIPEPGAITLLGIGLVGAAGLRWKRRR